MTNRFNVAAAEGACVMIVFILCLAGVILVALLLGMHLFGFVSLNPALRTLDGRTWVTAKQAIDATAPRLAKPLLLWCITATTCMLVSAAVTALEIIVVCSAVALVSLLVTLAAVLRGDLPINRAMAGWPREEPPADWREIRLRWERFFAIRTAANSLALFAAGVAAFLSAFAFR